MVFSSVCFFVLIISMIIVAELRASENECGVSWCSMEDGPAIRFPFHLKDREPNSCGHPGFDLSCTGKHTILELPSIPIKFSVDSINYGSQEIQLSIVPNIILQQIAELSLNQSMFSPFQFKYGFSSLTLMNCSSDDLLYLVYSETRVEDVVDSFVSCTKMLDFIASDPDDDESIDGFGSKYNALLWTWSKPNCSSCEERDMSCGFKKGGAEFETTCFERTKLGRKKVSSLQISGATIGSFVVVLLAILFVYIYTSDKIVRENRLRIEKFLEEYRALKPSRYTYADIKKITDQFKEKLGQGAYGTVFKGKLSSEILVAVKILNNISKGNGEEFINEVGTMGQIHHINVVRLVGYCADGFIRALVYEFLPNGSLEKYTSSAVGGTNHSLTWEKLQKIAIGVAKGIEYLHQGCDQRILHFDIKPNNILLDHNFTPKICDFGLAKLCSKDQSTVSMTTTRGTIGYIAPEVFSRNFGHVSYKSDVYSFGMLLLEMVGGRKNTNVAEENVDQIYYPEWIYNMLEEGEDLRIQIEEEGDAKIAKRLAIIGLWCIQWHPVGRPTMKFVVQMLEGGEELNMPPNPFASTAPSSSTTNTKMVASRIALELETISE